VGRGAINGQKGPIGRELLPDFVFSYVDNLSDVLDHLLVRPGSLKFSGTIQRGRRDDSSLSMIGGGCV